MLPGPFQILSVTYPAKVEPLSVKASAEFSFCKPYTFFFSYPFTASMSQIWFAAFQDGLQDGFLNSKDLVKRQFADTSHWICVSMVCLDISTCSWEAQNQNMTAKQLK